MKGSVVIFMPKVPHKMLINWKRIIGLVKTTKVTSLDWPVQWVDDQRLMSRLSFSPFGCWHVFRNTFPLQRSFTSTSYGMGLRQQYQPVVDSYHSDQRSQWLHVIVIFVRTCYFISRKTGKGCLLFCDILHHILCFCNIRLEWITEYKLA